MGAPLARLATKVAMKPSSTAPSRGSSECRNTGRQINFSVALINVDIAVASSFSGGRGFSLIVGLLPPHQIPPSPIDHPTRRTQEQGGTQSCQRHSRNCQ